MLRGTVVPNNGECGVCEHFLTDTPREGSASNTISRKRELIKTSACGHQCCCPHFSFLKKQQVEGRGMISLKCSSFLEDKSKCRENVQFFSFTFLHLRTVKSSGF